VKGGYQGEHGVVEDIGHTWGVLARLGFMEHLISQHIHIPELFSGWHWRGVEKGLRLFCVCFVLLSASVLVLRF
jgi:hypothetical protein